MARQRTGIFTTYLGANVRRARIKLDLTQDELAELTKFEVRFLRRIESGTVNLSIESIVRLADELNVAPAQLLRPTKVVRPSVGRPRKRKTSE